MLVIVVEIQKTIFNMTENIKILMIPQLFSYTSIKITTDC